MRTREGGHAPVIAVVGLGMVLIAALAGVALWYWSKRRRAVALVAETAPPANDVDDFYDDLPEGTAEA